MSSKSNVAVTFKQKDEYAQGDILITSKQIKDRLKELAQDISRRYKGQDLLLVAILNGAFVLTADLIRELHQKNLASITVEFVTASNYGAGTSSSGKVSISGVDKLEVAGRHVLLVDEIIETGLALSTLHSLIEKKGVASVSSLVLLTKKDKRQVEYEPEFIGFSIPDIWVQGYGMDTAGKGRENPDIVVGPL